MRTALLKSTSDGSADALLLGHIQSRKIQRRIFFWTEINSLTLATPLL
jgi:hypothetical protein